MGFDVEILVRLVWSGLGVINIPTQVRYPADGRSHFRYGRDNAQITRLLTGLVLQGLIRGPRRIWGAVTRPHSARRPWHEMAERGSLTGLRILLNILTVAGRPLLLIVMVPVVLYMFILGRAARRAAIAFQKRVLRSTGAPHAAVTPWWRAVKQFWNFGISIVDKVVSWRTPLPLSSFEWRGRDEVKARLARGQGVIFMSAHIGNVEVIRSLGDQRNVVIHALMYTGNSPHFRTFLEEVNKRSFVRVHDLTTLNTSLVFELQAALERGEVVALLADRVPKLSQGRTVAIPFLGDQAHFPEGPWILASLLGAPVYAVFSLRGADGRYHVEFTQLAERVDLPRAERPRLIAQYATTFADTLHTTIVRHPTQWYNFFDFWEK
jgi:predicted LPLAT superfamily acyltransferase